MDNVGKRVDVNGDKGRVMYYGPVAGKSSDYYGIDWEEVDRGRHDGSFEGKVYFKASGPKSGSFVSPSKVSFGKGFTEVFIQQYMVDDNPDRALKSDIYLSRDIEFVKRDQNLDFYRRCNNLYSVLFSKTDLKYFEPTELHFPHCTVLTISSSLMESWEDLAKITSLFPKLRVLNIFANRFESLSHVSDLAACTHHVPIATVSANNCGLDNESVRRLFIIFPHIVELYVAENSFDRVQIPEECQNLEKLSIYNNRICDFENLQSLSTLPRLKYLSISHCHLKNVAVSSGFAALETLVADGNEFSKWEDVHDLGKLTNLKHLTLKCLIPGECGVDSREIILAKFENLIFLDHCDVSPIERKNSERQFLQGIGSMRPIARVHQDDVDRLAAKHDFVFGDVGGELVGDLVTIRFNYGEKWFEKDFPLNMELIRVANLVCRVLGGNPRKMDYFYRQTDGIFDSRLVSMKPDRMLCSLDLCAENTVIMVDRAEAINQ